MLDFAQCAFSSHEFKRNYAKTEAPPQITLEASLHRRLGQVNGGYEFSRTEACLRQRFAQGDTCFVGAGHSGYVSIADGRRWAEARRFPSWREGYLDWTGRGYIYDGFTRSDRRVRGIDSAVRYFIIRSLTDATRLRCYSFMRGDNPIGLRAAFQYGKLIGKVLTYASVAASPSRWGIRTDRVHAAAYSGQFFPKARRVEQRAPIRELRGSKRALSADPTSKGRSCPQEHPALGSVLTTPATHSIAGRFHRGIPIEIHLTNVPPKPSHTLRIVCRNAGNNVEQFRRRKCFQCPYSPLR